MAKVKLVYPIMPGSKALPLDSGIAFEKYDGTNLHWVWDRELGWHAFGTRRDRYDLDPTGIQAFAKAHPGLEDAAHLFLDTLAGPIENTIKKLHFFDGTELIAFTEYLGDNSFAGKHKANEPKRLVFFDLQIDSNLLAPDLFVKHFQNLPIAKVVYNGKLTGKFCADVREGRYNVEEGVVCKGGTTGNVWMAKIKTNRYLQKLKKEFANDWESYWE